MAADAPELANVSVPAPPEVEEGDGSMLKDPPVIVPANPAGAVITRLASVEV